ncbi:MAG: hypothetical protein J6W69_02580 [Bacteroidales bacterium]|nr:hypothetical protein [Bacteroidales bacterium]
MRRAYKKPAIEVYEISTEGVIANSIPGGGEIPIGGVGTADAARRRDIDWDIYEHR